MILGKRPEGGTTKGCPFPRGTGGSNSFRKIAQLAQRHEMIFEYRSVVIYKND